MLLFFILVSSVTASLLLVIRHLMRNECEDWIDKFYYLHIAIWKAFG